MNPRGYTKKEDEDKRDKFSFDDFMNGEYKVRQFHAKWMSDGDSFLYKNEDGAVMEFNCTTNSTEMLMDNTTFRELNTGDWQISEDRMYVLLAHDMTKLYRHSKFAQYSVYSIKDRTRKKFEGPEGPIFRYIGWSPTGHSLVFVQNNNLYYLEDYDYHNTKKQAKQITFDGAQGEIFNGIPDWIYEEEVLGSDHALWWSTKGKQGKKIQDSRLKLLI
ncbi:hypothetical protein KUTeg_001718 [Tegillarca granosa]|uniref:Dipeptidylpeptidase IV N-terminal domain-containing protein n=1 Tax=Tegillarca granosa TaxID=220873 RepID=A0ABQ9FTQ1_TEGGR|nr:hypothetical protein KUTeg_001718 [Tegillarca granosa]